MAPDPHRARNGHLRAGGDDTGPIESGASWTPPRRRHPRCEDAAHGGHHHAICGRSPGARVSETRLKLDEKDNTEPNEGLRSPRRRRLPPEDRNGSRGSLRIALKGGSVGRREPTVFEDGGHQRPGTGMHATWSVRAPRGPSRTSHAVVLTLLRQHRARVGAGLRPPVVASECGPARPGADAVAPW